MLKAATRQAGRGDVVYMIGRALIGVVVGGFWSLSAATAMRLVPAQQVPRALAIFNGGNALATVVAAPLGSYLGAVVGWRGAFWGLVPVAGDVTPVRIFMQNSGQVAIAHVPTPAGHVRYSGEARIDGVPGLAAPLIVEFEDIAGASCGALLPTGNAVDVLDAIEVTCIDNGMPVVLLRARDLGCSGYESPAQLEADSALKARLESIRLQAGLRMNLGDVRQRNVPKMCLIAPAQAGGALCTRTFIPHRCHTSIGVFGAVSVAAACLIEGSVAAGLARVGMGDVQQLSVEHPTGEFTVELRLHHGQLAGCGLMRTARLLFDGVVCVPAAVWAG